MTIDKKINALEMRYTSRPNIKNAIALTLRCWLAWRIGNVPDPRVYLYKANHTAVTAQRNNTSDVRLYWLTAFIAIEMERFDNANEMLDMAMSYKSFFKANEPLHYQILYMLNAYLEIKQHRIKSAQRHMRVVEEAPDDNPIPSLLRGMLYLAMQNFNAAYQQLSKCYHKGYRGVFLFDALLTFYRAAPPTNGTAHLLLPTLHWALAQQADIQGILDTYQADLPQAFAAHAALGERIYQNAPDPWILREICRHRMLARDYGPEAYAFYKAAEQKQLHLPGLYHYLIKAAYKNNAENIHHYAMSEFLRAADMDVALKVYVYHLLLTDPTMTDLAPERKNEILQFCTYCLENDIKGRRVNSLYYYFWVQCNEMGITGKNVDKAEQLLLADLSRFEVTARNTGRPDAVQYIYITERERKGMVVYAMLSDEASGTTSNIITAVNDQFRYTCLGTERKHIIEEPLVIRRMLAPAEPALYRHFFRKGVRNFPLLAYLSNYYLQRLDDADTLEEAVAVLEAMRNEREIAKSYKMRITVALGSLYYRTGRFDRALAYYSEIDENYLDDAYIEQILNLFIQTHEWARAAGLILRKAHCVSERTLFDAVTRLSGEAFVPFHPNLADAAYGLLIKSWYDKKLLNLVLTHFRGSQAEWQALSRALAALSVAEPRLDEIILHNSVWMHQFDEGAQKTFVRMLESKIAPDTPDASVFAPEAIRQFIYFCAYEMILNDQKPLYETLNLLEIAYLCREKDMENCLLAYALCHVYLRYDISTFHSENILLEATAMQEAQGLLFPVFKAHRDKRPSSPYIEKNRPFLYRSLPDKQVWLHYRLDGETIYHAQRMTYLRFGLYMTNLAHFYNEKITYYFSEELPTGNITTKEKEFFNHTVYIDEQADDPFFIINNALIYEQMFKYDQVEQIITTLVKDTRHVLSGLL